MDNLKERRYRSHHRHVNAISGLLIVCWLMALVMFFWLMFDQPVEAGIGLNSKADMIIELLRKIEVNTRQGEQ